MAISGAAVSSNMGYSSSPSVTLLLSLFNVRLGWWLGNPGEAGDTSYQTDGPGFAAKRLLTEAFALTTDERPHVNLSDGGHFEDLGLYEMVRRQCRFIVRHPKLPEFQCRVFGDDPVARRRHGGRIAS